MLLLELGIVAIMAPAALAHGHIKSIVMNSKTYTGYFPVATPDYSLPPPGIIRKIDKPEEPLYDINHTNMTCNGGAYPIVDNGVARVGEVTAGSIMTYHWSDWPHLSPILTYMAHCPNDDCSTFNGTSGAVWFKIEELGTTPDDTWATQLLTESGDRWNVTIPACLAPGQYLVRHEIIQLTTARYINKCQFYPSCAQVKVIGSGTVQPSTDLVAIPGAYHATDPGILFNSFNTSSLTYVVPGPPVFVCPGATRTTSITVVPSSTSSTSTSEVVATTSSTTTTTTSSAVSSTTSSTRSSTSSTRSSTSSTRSSTSSTRSSTSSTRSSSASSSRTSTTAVATTTSAAGGTAALYGQCGGTGWTGPTTCVAGATCKYSNDFYSQCLPS